MQTSPASDKPVVVLIGNYPLDRQESMLRFHDLVQEHIAADGFTTESISPQGYLGKLAARGFWAKWFGYIDKYILFPIALAKQLSAIKRKYADRRIVVHICDHSNVVYIDIAQRWFPTVVTCHDLLAVRGALGEDTDCPASGFGKRLQEAILRGLGKATYVVCVSRATQSDLVRLAGPAVAERSEVIPLALNYAYGTQTPEESQAVLARAKLDLPYHGFLLHVGSSLRRKNREALLLSAAQIKDSWSGPIVFAGEPLSDRERTLVGSLHLEKRIRQVLRPDNDTLHALYCSAHCFVFMSRFEGFGWPLLEAQVSGCPVICSNRTSVPEVAGEGALVHEPDDYVGVAQDIRRLQDAAFRDNVIARGFRNAQGFTSERLVSAYEKVYRRIS
jgi:glycosyltransferase involved in cell wall biosynthesis